MSDIKTVSVTSKDPAYHGGEPFTINEEDFIPETHEIYDPEKLVEPSETSDDPKGKKKK